MARKSFGNGVLDGFLAMDANQRAWADQAARQKAQERLDKAYEEQEAIDAALAEAYKPKTETTTTYNVEGQKFADQQTAGLAAAQKYDQNTQAIGNEVGGLSGAEIEGARPAIASETQTKTIKPTQAQALKRAQEIMLSKGMGLQALKIQEQYNKVRKEGIKDALQDSMLSGSFDGLNKALSIYNENVPDGNQAEAAQLDDGTYGIVSTNQKTGKKALVGGQRFKTPYEMMAAMHTMVSGAPMDYVRLVQNNEAKQAIAQERISAQQENAKLRQAHAMEMRLMGGMNGGRSSSGSRTGGDNDSPVASSKEIENLLKEAIGKDEVFEAIDPKDPTKKIPVQSSEVFLRANQYARDLLQNNVQGNARMNPAQAVVIAKDLAREKLGIEPMQYKSNVGVDALGNVSVGVVDKKTGVSAGRLHPVVRDYRAVLNDDQYKEAVLKQTQATLGIPGDNGQLTEDRITDFYKKANGVAPDGMPVAAPVDVARDREELVKSAMSRGGMSRQQAEMWVKNFAQHSALWVQENAARKAAAKQPGNRVGNARPVDAATQHENTIQAMLQSGVTRPQAESIIKKRIDDAAAKKQKMDEQRAKIKSAGILDRPIVASFDDIGE